MAVAVQEAAIVEAVEEVVAELSRPSTAPAPNPRPASLRPVR